MQMMQLLKDVITNPNYPEYNGYNTRYVSTSRDAAYAKDRCDITSLIDNPSAVPDTKY